LSFFINQRGYEAKYLPILLEQLLPPTKNFFYINTEKYNSEFERIHDTIVDLHTASVHRFAECWMSFLAGVKFIDACRAGTFLFFTRCCVANDATEE
jgi:hypothetical protein